MKNLKEQIENLESKETLTDSEKKQLKALKNQLSSKPDYTKPYNYGEVDESDKSVINELIKELTNYKNGVYVFNESEKDGKRFIKIGLVHEPKNATKGLETINSKQLVKFWVQNNSYEVGNIIPHKELFVNVVARINAIENTQGKFITISKWVMNADQLNTVKDETFTKQQGVNFNLYRVKPNANDYDRLMEFVCNGSEVSTENMDESLYKQLKESYSILGFEMPNMQSDEVETDTIF